MTDYAGKKGGPADKPGDSEKTEKSSGGESTTKTETASNTKGEGTAKRKDPVAKSSTE